MSWTRSCFWNWEQTTTSPSPSVPRNSWLGSGRRCAVRAVLSPRKPSRLTEWSSTLLECRSPATATKSPSPPKEFKIVKYMAQNPNRVISREELLNDVWGYQNYPTTRTVDNHILKLRQKLEADPANPVHFRTVHGVGYKFVP